MKSRLELQQLFQNIFAIEQIKVTSHLEEIARLLRDGLTKDKNQDGE